MRRSLLVGVAIVAMACGSLVGEDTQGSTQGASEGGSTQAGSADGATTSAVTSATSATSATSTTSATSPGDTSSGSTGADTVACMPDPPVEVSPPPDGCEQVYLDDAEGLSDPTRPAGMWWCDSEVYRVLPVACACEHFRAPCPTGDAGACGEQGACDPGEDCVGSCYCEAQCNSDAECPAGHACLCASGLLDSVGVSSYNVCLPAECFDDDDCDGSQRCRISENACRLPESFRCTTSTDECQGSADCPDQFCGFDERVAHWRCEDAIPCE